MKLNKDKSHLLMSANKSIADIDNNHIKSKDTHELLRITIDSNLIFETYINNFCKKASQKLKDLAGISNHLNFDKR